MSVKRTLKELGINRSTFYNWYQRYVEDGYDGLAYKYQPPRQFWNAIPQGEREKVVEIALEVVEVVVVVVVVVFVVIVVGGSSFNK